MRTQVVNNSQGPHYIQGQKTSELPATLLILRCGLNLVDSKLLADMRKANKGFDGLFSKIIQPSKSIEADPLTFGKPTLEVRGKELEDKAPLAALPVGEAQAIVALTQDTDLLSGWLSECMPGKQSDLIKALNERLRFVASGFSEAA